VEIAGKRGRKATTDIYDHEGKLAAKLENLEKSKRPTASKDAIVKFVNKCAPDGLSLARRPFCTSCLRGLAEMMGTEFTTPTAQMSRRLWRRSNRATKRCGPRSGTA